MKVHHKVRNIVGAVLIAAVIPAWAADSLTKYSAKIPSKVQIEGTSTIHDWEVTSGTIGGTMELPDLKSASPGKVNAKVFVRIPVKTLKSSTGPAMDGIMYEAFKLPNNAYRFIDFRLSELVLKEAKSPNGPYKFDSTGELTICGVTNKINMPLTIEMVGAQPKASGGFPLKMTSYGITPPAPKAFPAIKTGDDVKITFEALLEPAK
jgi:hypothetical protein